LRFFFKLIIEGVVDGGWMEEGELYLAVLAVFGGLGREDDCGVVVLALLVFETQMRACDLYMSSTRTASLHECAR